MTETEKQELEPRKPEKVYDDWQIEAIERVTGFPVETILGGEVLIRDNQPDILWVLFQFDGTREGFQAAFKEWSYANEEIEPPF